MFCAPTGDHPELPVHCRVHGGRRGDERLLEALNPNEIALALAAADEVADRHQRVGRAAELAVERARYEADRAERAFHAVEPDNRLVARSLETRWEAKLASLDRSGVDTEAARDTLPPLPGRPAWRNSPPTCPGSARAHHQQQGPQTAAAHRDRRYHPAPRTRTRPGADRDPLAHRRIRRTTGSSFRSPRNSRAQPLTGSGDGDRLGPITDTNELAGLLNAAGMTTGHDRRSTPKPSSGSDTPTTSPPRTPTPTTQISVADTAKRLGIGTGTSTTGSRRANSPPDADPATGSASPGRSRSRPNAVAA